MTSIQTRIFFRLQVCYVITNVLFQSVLIIINILSTSMSQRLQLISDQIKGVPRYVESSFDYFNNPSYITKQENQIRLKVRKFVETWVIPYLDEYVQEAKFPQYLIPKLRELDPLQWLLQKPYGNTVSITAKGMILAEFARGDPGLALMLLVHYCLLGNTIQMLGSEQQKAYYLPKLRSFQIMGGWGLTQLLGGSDVSNMDTNVTQIDDNTFKINGKKRWIGTANRDILLVWAKNTVSKKVQAFIVDKGTPGFTTQVIKHKGAVRIVQNCDITLENVIVTKDKKLPLATDFQNGTNKVLRKSRIQACWQAVGIATRVYDVCIKYATDRNQFGARIASYQLIQQKIVKIMAHTQSIFFLVLALSKLQEQGMATIGRISMVKAHVSQQLRDIARWGRQVFGGNGILYGNYVMRAISDAEVFSVGEGTYEVNTLVAGRQLTGLNAFKSK